MRFLLVRTSFVGQDNYAKGSSWGCVNIEVAGRLRCVLKIPGGSLRLVPSLTLSNQSHLTIELIHTNIFQVDGYKGRWDDGSESILHSLHWQEWSSSPVNGSHCHGGDQWECVMNVHELCMNLSVNAAPPSVRRGSFKNLRWYNGRESVYLYIGLFLVPMGHWHKLPS